MEFRNIKISNSSKSYPAELIFETGNITRLSGPNGVGKTAAFRSIMWALFGVMFTPHSQWIDSPGKEHPPQHFIGDPSKPFSVTLNLKLSEDQRIFSVERSFLSGELDFKITPACEFLSTFCKNRSNSILLGVSLFPRAEFIKDLVEDSKLWSILASRSIAAARDLTADLKKHIAIKNKDAIRLESDIKPKNENSIKLEGAIEMGSKSLGDAEKTRKEYNALVASLKCSVTSELIDECNLFSKKIEKIKKDLVDDCPDVKDYLDDIFEKTRRSLTPPNPIGESAALARSDLTRKIIEQRKEVQVLDKIEEVIRLNKEKKEEIDKELGALKKKKQDTEKVIEASEKISTFLSSPDSALLEILNEKPKAFMITVIDDFLNSVTDGEYTYTAWNKFSARSEGFQFSRSLSDFSSGQMSLMATLAAAAIRFCFRVLLKVDIKLVFIDEDAAPVDSMKTRFLPHLYNFESRSRALVVVQHDDRVRLDRCRKVEIY